MQGHMARSPIAYQFQTYTVGNTGLYIFDVGNSPSFENTVVVISEIGISYWIL